MYQYKRLLDVRPDAITICSQTTNGGVLSTPPTMTTTQSVLDDDFFAVESPILSPESSNGILGAGN